MPTRFPHGLSANGLAVLPGAGGGDSSGGSLPTTTGTIFWVSSVDGSDSNSGLAPTEALATVAAANALCTASKGDVIALKEGHTETLTTAVIIKAGVSVIGLGEGTLQAQFTVNAAIDGFDLTSGNVVLENIYFNEATSASATSDINIAAANVTLRRVHIDAGANDIDTITVTAAGELPIIEECTVIVTANGPDSWIKFEGVIDRPIIRNNIIIGSDGTNAYDDGVFDFNNVAVTNPIIYGNVFNGGAVATTVIANGGSVTGAAYGPNVYAGLAVDADNMPTLAALGANNADNAYSSSSVVANSDGSVLERQEWIQQAIGLLAADYRAANYLAVTATFSSATWNTVAAHEIAAITGAVRILILPQCTGTLTSSGGNATIILGDETTTNSIIASSDAEALATGEWWADATMTRTLLTKTLINGLDLVIGAGKDIGYTIGTEALTGGSIVFHIFWVPLDATGAVAAGAGGVL